MTPVAEDIADVVADQGEGQAGDFTEEEAPAIQGTDGAATPRESAARRADGRARSVQQARPADYGGVAMCDHVTV